MIRRSTLSRGRTFLKREKSIKRQSQRSIKYENFRNLKLVKDRNEEGLIHCQDRQIGLPACGVSIPTPDLHHTEGRDGELLFNEAKMVWLIRKCHRKAHDEAHNPREHAVSKEQ